MSSAQGPPRPLTFCPWRIAKVTSYKLEFYVNGVELVWSTRPCGGRVTTMVSEMLSKLTLFYDCIAYHPQWMLHDAAKEVHDALLTAGCCHTSLCVFYAKAAQALPCHREGTLRAAHCTVHSSFPVQPTFRMDVDGDPPFHSSLRAWDPGRRGTSL